MSTKCSLHQDVIAAVKAAADKENKALPSWLTNEESEIIHPTVTRTSPVLSDDWWVKDNKPIILALTFSPEVRVEAEYHVTFLENGVQTVTRVKDGKKSAVVNSNDWVYHARKAIPSEDRYLVQVTVTVEPSRGGNTLFREISNVSFRLLIFS